MKNKILIILVLLVFIAILAITIYSLLSNKNQNIKMEEIILTTSDGVQLYGDYYSSQKPNSSAVLLLHMMPATKESWREFSKKLQEAGFQALAIDFRGHGKSVFKNNHSIDYRRFTDTEHQQKIHDIETAVEFLIKEKNPPEIFLIGASIGANLIPIYMSEHKRITAGFLLSPGLDYHGVKPEEFINKMAADQSLYILASENDKYSTESAKKLYNIAKTKKELKILKNPSHGTDMFKSNPELMDEIVNQLKSFTK